MKRWLCVILSAFSFSFAAGASAQCAGFNDVSDAAPFCPEVEWIKNRGVTTGCSATLYCPDEAVTRTRMAQFMKRLGTALTPVLLSKEGAFNVIALSATPAIQCISDPFAPTGYPRKAFVSGVTTLTLDGPGTVGMGVYYSTDGGANWTSLHSKPFGASLAVPAGITGTATNFYPLSMVALGTPLDLNPGTTYTFGVGYVRVTLNPAVGNVSAGDCGIRIEVRSRDGASSPF